ncbi:MAG TPA: hypothetical protein VFK90_16035 [Anaeromyxobacter sp.]|nr:hypothetical protein [Anaeromyxobacter sp.]
MTRLKILIVTAPLALGGLGVAAWQTFRVNALERELAALGTEGKAAGASFVQTLQGDFAERQRAAYDRRREIAIELATARRNRLLGILGVAAAGLVGAALSVMSRIAADIEEDRRHVGS